MRADRDAFIDKIKQSDRDALLCLISNEQMKMAADRGDHYILLSVTYDYHQKKVDRVKVYENLCRQLAKGKLVNIAERYCFEVSGV